MASELDLTTVATAAEALRVSSAEPGLARLLTTASELLAGWVGYPLHRRLGVVETCAGGAPRLFLRSGAVRSVASVVVYGEEWPADTWRVEDADKGILLARGCTWPFTGRTGGGVSEAPLYREDTGAIAVTFDAGWVTPGQVELAAAATPPTTLTRDLPMAFEQACLVALAATVQASGQNPNVSSLSLGSGSLTFRDSAEAALPTQARSLVARYRRLARGTP